MLTDTTFFWLTLRGTLFPATVPFPHNSHLRAIAYPPSTKFNVLSESHHLCPGNSPREQSNKAQLQPRQKYRLPNMCKESGRICVIVQGSELFPFLPCRNFKIIYTAGMHDYLFFAFIKIFVSV